MSEQKVCPTCGTGYPLSELFCARDGTALRSSSAAGDLVGTVIAERYHVLKKIGEGGMGQVYLAEHVKMGRKAALKVMHPDMHQDADAIARFSREAANASRLSHPNVCGIYDFGETSDGLIYLAMEFIEGESLTSLIAKSGTLAAPRAAAIIQQTAAALTVAHEAGIVHRDLKPDNIMIARARDGSDLVKVVDFGIAKASTGDAQKLTGTGLVVGTPEYMSPEQLSGDAPDPRSDIYSLGLVAFNCLTGALPFDSKSAQEAMIKRLIEEPMTLADLKPDVAWPAELQAVMDRALARFADARYQSAAEFGREMTQAVERMPAAIAAGERTQLMESATVASAVVPKTRLAPPSASAAPTRGTSVTESATPSTSRRTAMIGGGVLLIGVTVAVVLMQRPPAPSVDGATGAALAPKPVAAPIDSSGVPAAARAAPTPTGAKSAPVQAKAAPAPANPAAAPTRTNEGGAAATVQSTVDRWMRRFSAAVTNVTPVTNADARDALDDVSRVLPAAAGLQKAQLHWIQSLAYAELNDERTCSAARQAVTSGLKGDELTAAKGIVGSPLCKP